MIRELRVALRSGDPDHFLLLVSGMIAATDRSAGTAAVGIDALVDAFADTPVAETTAALTAMSALLDDLALVARIDGVLAARRHPLPAWLRHLREARPRAEVWRADDEWGEDTIWHVGMPLVGAPDLVAVVLVDQNRGPGAQTGFVMRGHLREAVERTRIAYPTMTVGPGDPAEARAAVFTLVDATTTGPGAEAEDLADPADRWPLCVPLARWMVRHLAEALVPPAPRHTADDVQALADRFAASPWGETARQEFTLAEPCPEHERWNARDVGAALLRYAAAHGDGDPLRWGPGRVELVLLDWVPTSDIPSCIQPDVLPVLEALVRFCGAETGQDESATEAVVEAIADVEGEYLDSAVPDGPVEVGEMLLGPLADQVGGFAALQELDDEPLPDEALDVTGLSPDIVHEVVVWARLCDTVADRLLDVEHRTAMRRLITRAARGDAAVFRRGASSAKGAAAVAWAVGRANGSVGPGSGRTVQELLAEFRVGGSVSQRAETVLRAAGIAPSPGWNMSLEDPSLLTGGRRAAMMRQRDEAMALVASMMQDPVGSATGPADQALDPTRSTRPQASALGLGLSAQHDDDHPDHREERRP